MVTAPILSEPKPDRVGNWKGELGTNFYGTLGEIIRNQFCQNPNWTVGNWEGELGTNFYGTLGEIIKNPFDIFFIYSTYL